MRNLGTNLIHRGLWDCLVRCSKFQNGGRENQLFKTGCYIRVRHTWSKAAWRKPQGVHCVSASRYCAMEWKQAERKSISLKGLHDYMYVYNNPDFNLYLATFVLWTCSRHCSFLSLFSALGWKTISKLVETPDKHAATFGGRAPQWTRKRQAEIISFLKWSSGIRKKYTGPINKLSGMRIETNGSQPQSVTDVLKSPCP